MSNDVVDFIGAFPSPILTFGHDYYDKFRDDLIEYCYELKAKDSGVKKSNNGGWQSDAMMIDERFAKHIFKTAADTLDLYLHEDYTCSIGNLWVNINPPGATNDRHTHPGADLAAIFYVKVPDGDAGDLEIENPNHFAQFNLLEFMDPKLKEKAKASHSLWFSPIEGSTVIMPSNLLHRVMTNNTNEDRISIAWNMKIVDRE